MLKLFVKFYLVIAIPLVFLFIPALNPINKMVEGWAAALYAKEYNGLLYLLDRELENIPEHKWQQHIEELNNHFGYQVALRPLIELSLAKNKIERLQNDETVFQSGRSAKLYKRVRNTGNVFVLNLGNSRDDEVDDAIKGPVYMLNKILADFPASEWSEVLNTLSQHSGIKVQIIKKDLVLVAVAINSRLEQGKAFHYEKKKHVLFMYAPTTAPEFLYQFGPVDERLFRRRVDNLNRIVPAALLALGILILAWPLYRDIDRLRRGAISFGKGNFNTRVQVGLGSSLLPLATAFNTMAAGILNLIKSHKDLTNAVSHELKTPVTRLRFSLEMLRENPEEGDRLRYLANIENDLGDLENLISELLDHAHYDRTTVSGRFEKLDLGQWLGEIVQPHRDFSGEIDIIVQGKKKSACMVHFDQRAMEKAVNNLMNNALHYADSTILVTLDCGEREVTLKVEDDGPGVIEQEREHIFEPFVRTDSSRQRKTGGSGLGLAIVKQVAKMHNGTVWCDASPLGGACFILRWKKTVTVDAEKTA